MVKSHISSEHKKPKINKKMAVATAIVFVVFGILATYFGIAWYQGFKFKQTETKMNQLADAFVSELGEPANKSSNQSCGYASAPYGRGFLSCSTNTRLFYNIKNVSQAREYVEKARGVLGTSGVVSVLGTQNIPSSWNEHTTGNSMPSDTIETFTPKNSCVIYYKLLKISDSRTLQLSITCTTNPMRPFYPVSG